MENLELLSENPLFDNIPAKEIPNLLHCLGAEEKRYAKGDILFHLGSTVTRLGIVLRGAVRAESTDYLGDRSIISVIKPGQFLCDAYSSTSGGILLVDVTAQTDCAVLFIETRRLMRPCGENRDFGRLLSENLTHVLAQKYVDLVGKVIHLSGRTTRRKLLSYLSEQFRFSNGEPFSIPMNQQELADYLFVERSGLCVALGSLKREGILRPVGDKYVLVNPETEKEMGIGAIES